MTLPFGGGFVFSFSWCPLGVGFDPSLWRRFRLPLSLIPLSVGFGPINRHFFGSPRRFLDHLPHETTVKPILRNILAGIKFIPAENSTGRLFGHGLFRAISRLEMVQKSLKMMRRSRRRRSRRRRSSQGHRSDFSPISQIFRFQPWEISTIFSNETTATANFPQIRLKSAF